jgi:hypothetical protein
MLMPDIRIRLHQIADERGIPELHDLAEATKRRYHGRSARKVSETVTPDLADAVRAYRKAYPDLPEHKVSELFRLNQGRVSEILHGKRS